VHQNTETRIRIQKRLPMLKGMLNLCSTHKAYVILLLIEMNDFCILLQNIICRNLIVFMFPFGIIKHQLFCNFCIQPNKKRIHSKILGIISISNHNAVVIIEASETTRAVRSCSGDWTLDEELRYGGRVGRVGQCRTIGAGVGR